MPAQASFKKRLVYALVVAFLIFCFKTFTGSDNDTYYATITSKVKTGDAAAEFALGNMYMTGSNLPKDPAKAVEWYRKSADQGYSPAEVRMGILYERGDGVPKDQTEADKWYQKAASHGYTSPKFLLDHKDSAFFVFVRSQPQWVRDALFWLALAFTLIGIPVLIIYLIIKTYRVSTKLFRKS